MAGVNLNPEAQGRREKVYQMVIKNCTECPFWRTCKANNHLQDDFKFPVGCELQTWRGEGKYVRYRDKG